MDKAAAKFMRPVITCIHHFKVKGKQCNDIHADVLSDTCIKSREHARADRSSQMRTISLSLSTTEGHDPSRNDDQVPINEDLFFELICLQNGKI